MLEAYESYGDYDTMAALTRDLVQTAAQDVLGTDRGQRCPTARSTTSAASGPQLTMYGSLSESLGEEITPSTTPATRCAVYADKLGVETDPKRVSHGKLVELLWEHQVGDHLFAPDIRAGFPGGDDPAGA